MGEFVDHVEIRTASDGKPYVVTVARNGEDLDVSETFETDESAEDHAEALAHQLEVQIEEERNE